MSEDRTGFPSESFPVVGQPASWCDGFSSEVVMSISLLGVFKQRPMAVVQVDREDRSQVGRPGLGGL